MTVLLRKDFYLLCRHMLFLPLCILVMICVCAMGNQSSLALLLEIGMVSIGMVEVVMELEEGCRWHVLQDTMPLSRRRVVWEKYVFLTLTSAGVALLQAILNTAWGWITMRHVEAGNVLFLPAIIFSAAMLSGSIVMPVFFGLGLTRGRSVYFAVLGTGLVLALVISRIYRIPQHIPLHPVVLMLAVLAVGVSVGAISCGLSVWLYRRREIR